VKQLEKVPFNHTSAVVKVEKPIIWVISHDVLVISGALPVLAIIRIH